MNCLREARLVTAAMMIGVALAGAGRADDAKPKATTKLDTDAAAAEQVWEGKLSVGAGLSLRIVVHVGKTAEGKLTAKMDSPDQGAKGLKVDTITLDKTTLSFEMKALMGRYEGKLNADGTEAAGTWTQAGNSLPLTLKKTDKATELRRPQTPKAPFPYKVGRGQLPEQGRGSNPGRDLDRARGPRALSGPDTDQRLGRPGPR